MPKPCSVRNSALEQPSSIRNRRFALARRKKKKKKKMPPAGVAYFFHRRKLVEGSLASYPRQDGVVAARVLRDRGNRNICDANKHTEQTRPHISTIWGVRGGFGTSEKWNRGSVRYLVFFFLLLFFFFTLSTSLSVSNRASCSARTKSDSVWRSSPISSEISSICIAFPNRSKNVTN